MNIDSITNGYVLDHIKSGRSMEIYNYLELNKLDCSVAIIKNVKSSKMGKKDIIKIDSPIKLDLAVLSYVDPGITINVIENGKLLDKMPLDLPDKIVNIIKCKNPRCITSVEPELDSIFTLRTKNDQRIYRCAYCEMTHKR
ncbi:MAG: aspartate carbamoyltransferase regulatory subunit [Eubacteriales bacterium]